MAFKDKILSMLSEEAKTLPGKNNLGLIDTLLQKDWLCINNDSNLTFPEYQSNLRKKRQVTKMEAEQSRNILQPEMVCHAEYY